MKWVVVLLPLVVLQLCFTDVTGANTNGACTSDHCDNAKDTCDALVASGALCKTKIGQNCSATTDCITNAACDSVGKPCACKDNFTPNSNKTVCLKNIDEGCTAGKSDECVPNTKPCTSPVTTCTCIDNYVATDSNSKCKAKADSDCVAVGDCIENAVCSAAGQPCKCSENYTPKDDKTVCLSKVGHTCDRNDDCAPGATCTGTTNKQCTCPDKSTPDRNKEMCRKELYQTCANDGECGVNAACSNKNCTCKPDFKPDTDGLCVKPAGGSCTVDADCPTSSSCGSDKKCNCDDGYEKSGDVCQKSGAADLLVSVLLMVVAFVGQRFL